MRIVLSQTDGNAMLFVDSEYLKKKSQTLLSPTRCLGMINVWTVGYVTRAISTGKAGLYLLIVYPIIHVARS